MGYRLICFDLFSKNGRCSRLGTAFNWLITTLRTLTAVATISVTATAFAGLAITAFIAFGTRLDIGRGGRCHRVAGFVHAGYHGRVGCVKAVGLGCSGGCHAAVAAFVAAAIAALTTFSAFTAFTAALAFRARFAVTVAVLALTPGTSIGSALLAR